ncbi:MAG TPA: M15 family metallopeptidase [Chthoniobacterales bacterium]|jgi:peptidoglycan L-alanyl-D-glutamate endopeptidase CwlK|nr:M15 family metallopeptidase [Chthoniobacterales bacterium]
MNLRQIIRAVQRELQVDIDGYAGPQTWEAIYRRVVPAATDQQTTASNLPSLFTGRVDERSESKIAMLLPEVQPYARALVTKATGMGITTKVISGTRTYAEQDALYEQGRSKPGKIVTKARGGYSNHNFGIAFDVGIFDGPKYIAESPAYKAVGIIGIDLGLAWGGNWTTMQDEPHFELRPNWAAKLSESDMLAELRSRKESGKAIYA